MSASNNSKLNTLIGILTLACAVIGGVFFIAPLKTLPGDVKIVQTDVQGMQRTQAVQTEALKSLTEVTKEASALRRDLDKTAIELKANQDLIQTRIDTILNRLDRLETPRPQVSNNS